MRAWIITPSEEDQNFLEEEEVQNHDLKNYYMILEEDAERPEYHFISEDRIGKNDFILDYDWSPGNSFNFNEVITFDADFAMRYKLSSEEPDIEEIDISSILVGVYSEGYEDTEVEWWCTEYRTRGYDKLMGEYQLDEEYLRGKVPT